MSASNSFVWPDPLLQRIVTRDLTVLRNRRRRKVGGKKGSKIEPLVLKGAQLIELVPLCLYEVPADCHKLTSGVRELLPGRILSLNKTVSEHRKGGLLMSEEEECFYSFENVYKARRGLTRVQYNSHIFRTRVLTHYIRRLEILCCQLKEWLRVRVSDSWLTASGTRTPRLVRDEVDSLLNEAKELRTIVSLPFSRSLSRCADDLVEAAHHLIEAANNRCAQKIVQAKDCVALAYRATIQMDCRARLEEIIFQVGVLVVRKQEVSASQQPMWQSELHSITKRLTKSDSLTGKKLEHGFKHPVLPRVIPRVHLAIKHLMRPISEVGPNLIEMQKQLKLATAPM